MSKDSTLKISISHWKTTFNLNLVSKFTNLLIHFPEISWFHHDMMHGDVEGPRIMFWCWLQQEETPFLNMDTNFPDSEFSLYSQFHSHCLHAKINPKDLDETDFQFHFTLFIVKVKYNNIFKSEKVQNKQDNINIA